MQSIKRIVREIHRRSLWQVLGIYLVCSWVVIQVVDVLADNMSLPPWTFPFAVILLLIGLPIVLATAFVQEGIGARGAGESAPSPATAAGDPENGRARTHRFLTWRNAVLGGILAFALWGVVAAGWLVMGGSSGRPVAGAGEENHSIAVLPFTSVQKDEDSQAFVTGIHDDLLTQLSKIDSLTVISRTSVMKYRDTQIGIPEIARELGVATVLEGGVQRSGSRVRVNVQLIEAETDKHLWAETYDEQLTAANIFEIQSDLARKIAGALRTRLTPETRARIEARPTESLEAYDLVSRARFVINSRGATRDGLQAAGRLYQAAIVADSAYAPAHLGLVRVLYELWNLGYLTESEALPQSWAGLEKAVSLDPNLADAHAVRGTLLRLTGKLEDAERAFRRALELNPGSVAAHSGYSAVLLEMGRAEDALREARRAVQLDPQSAAARRSLLARLVFVHQYGEAIEESNHLLEMKPDEADAYYYAAIAWTGRGDHKRAEENYRKAIDLNPADPYYPAGLAWSYARAGNRPAALEALQLAEKLEVPLKESALVYAALGDLDRAFDYLDRAFRTEPASLYSLIVDPGSEPLRKDPRWNALMRKLKPE